MGAPELVMFDRALARPGAGSAQDVLRIIRDLNRAG